jgi:RimJ/RimL family protein N-acetyltransferase
MIKLETERLLLRRFERSDAESMFRNWASDPDVVRFLPYDACLTLEDTKRRIDRWIGYFAEAAPGAWEPFAIVLKSSGDVIGTIDYAEYDRKARSAEVGYQIGKAWWGSGYATEALGAVLKHCFETVGMRRVWADHDTRNPASGRVMQKAGMIFEKTIFKSKEDGGEPVGRSQYAIRAEQYFEPPRKE